MRGAWRCLVAALGLALATGSPAAEEWPSAAQAASLLGQVGSDVPSLQPVGEVALYAGEELAAHLEAEAETLLAYGPEWLVAASFADRRSQARLTAELLGFPTELDAFGAFSRRRDPRPAGTVIPLPGQTSLVSAYWAGARLHVWRGPLYLRVTAEGDDEALRPQLLLLAAALVARLPTMAADPLLFKLPPTRNLIVESVKFRRAEVWDLPSLRNGLLATYGRRVAPGKLEACAELLLLDGLDDEGAQAAYAALQDYLGEGGSPRSVSALGEAAVTVRHKRLGSTYAMKQAHYVVVVYQVKEAALAESMLREIGKKIRLSEEAEEQPGTGEADQGPR